jgi:hypothetical protein
MEIELEFGKGIRNVLLPLASGLLIGLAAIGRALTPEGGGLLTPSAWRLRTAERAYATELTELRRQAEALADLMNDPPDAVRAGIVADRIEQLTRDGEPGLTLQRQALVEAATQVRLWSMGGAERQQAEEALAQAIEVLAR